MRNQALVGFGLLFFSFVTWWLTGGLGWVDFPPGSPLKGWQVHALALPLPGLILGLALLLMSDAANTRADDAPLDIATARTVVTLLLAGLVFLLAAGAVAGKVEVLRAAALLAAASVTLVLALAVISELRRSGPLAFESHWGGLGGAFSGVRIPAAAVLIVLLLAFAGATLTAGLWSPGKAETSAAKNDPGSVSDKAGAADPGAAPEKTP